MFNMKEPKWKVKRRKWDKITRKKLKKIPQKHHLPHQKEEEKIPI